MPFLGAGLPLRRETAVLAHPSPRRGGVCLAPSPRCRPRVTQLCVWCVPDCRGHRVPRAPLPGTGVTRAEAASRPPGGALPPRRRSYGLMRQTTTLPTPRLAPCAQGLCRLSPVPAGRWPFPTLSLRPLCRCSDPYPAALLGCACPLLHRGHRPHPTGDGFGARIDPHMQLRWGAVFRGCSHSITFGLLHSLGPQTAPTAAPKAPGRQAFHTTHRPAGYPHRDVASLHVRHGQLTWLDFHQLGRSLVGCSFPHTALR